MTGSLLEKSVLLAVYTVIRRQICKSDPQTKSLKMVSVERHEMLIRQEGETEKLNCKAVFHSIGVLLLAACNTGGWSMSALCSLHGVQLSIILIYHITTAYIYSYGVPCSLAQQLAERKRWRNGNAGRAELKSGPGEAVCAKRRCWRRRDAGRQSRRH